MRKALSIAGSDSGGGAGVQADLKTFQRFGVFGTTALTLITAQNTVGVQEVHLLPRELIVSQIEAVAGDLRPHALKTGALGSPAIIEAVAEAITRLRLGPLVLDPVAISKHGHPLAGPESVRAMADVLFPLATLITPNLHEAGAFLGSTPRSEAEMKDAAAALAAMGPRAVLVKGGALEGSEAVDFLYAEGELHRLSAPRVRSRSTHGTGCAYSAAITAHLAMGLPLREAVQQSKAWIGRAIASARPIGKGIGPINLVAA